MAGMTEKRRGCGAVAELARAFDRGRGPLEAGADSSAYDRGDRPPAAFGVSSRAGGVAAGGSSVASVHICQGASQELIPAP